MSRFKTSHNRDVPGLNLAALPDLIFTVLFFFMIVTHMRQVTPRVRYQVPQGTEVEKERKAGLVYLFIGKPVDEQGRVVGDETRIQLNDRYVTVAQIPDEISRLRATLSDGQHPCRPRYRDGHNQRCQASITQSRSPKHQLFGYGLT